MRIIRLVILCLLLLLPLALQGQAISYKEYNKPVAFGDSLKLRQRPPEDWLEILLMGGMLRFGDNDEYFVRIPRGINGLMMMDFVNGYSVGPQTTFGKVLRDYSRIEIDETVRWACSRETLMAKGALRYVFAPQFFGFFEIFGGRYTNDFDRYPVMDEAHRSFASGLFGWNHFKLYDQTTFGARLYGALNKDLQITGLVAWEKRGEVENHRQRSIFGKTARDNVPEVQRKRMEPFGTDKILRIDGQIDWMRGRQILIVDDMNAIAHSDNPNFSFRTTSGWGRGGVRFLSLDASITGEYLHRKSQNPKDADYYSGWTIKYYASAGFFPVRKNVLLMDARHFDASQFAYQQTLAGPFCFTNFSLLDNYELSTSKCWVEAHAEHEEIGSMLYTQAHTVKVPGRPLHTEIGTGITIPAHRLGLTIGFDDLKFDGIAFNLIISLQD